MVGIKKILMAMLMVSVSSAWSAEKPLEIIKKNDSELQKLLKNKKKSEAEIDKIKFLINGIFDFETLGKKALPSTVWKEITEAQQKTFVSDFQRMVENSSVKKLEVYESDSTVYDVPEESESKVSIIAHVWSKGKESILEYKMKKDDSDKWRAYDLVIDELSTSRNYRDQFKKILEEKSFDELLEKIRKKADGFEE